MTRWLIRWLVSAAALAAVAWLNIGVRIDGIPQLGRPIDGGVQTGGLVTLALSTLVIGLVNSLVRPILQTLFLPLNCLTFGLFAFVLNGILFAATSLVVSGFNATLLGGIIGSALMGIIGGALASALGSDRNKH